MYRLRMDYLFKTACMKKKINVFVFPQYTHSLPSYSDLKSLQTTKRSNQTSVSPPHRLLIYILSRKRSTKTLGEKDEWVFMVPHSLLKSPPSFIKATKEKGGEIDSPCVGAPLNIDSPLHYSKSTSGTHSTLDVHCSLLFLPQLTAANFLLRGYFSLPPRRDSLFGF